MNYADNLSRSHTFDSYIKTKDFPGEERFGITSQIRRASVSIATNIAYASACEVECLLLISNDLEFIDQQTLSSLQKELNEIKKMLFAFAKKLMADG